MMDRVRTAMPQRRQRRFSRMMQVVLVGICLSGVVTGNPKALVNGGVGLGVTLLPALLERNYRLSLDPWLSLWVTTAVFLHTIGSAGFYDQILWWDHLTHAFSASLMAGLGYVTVRAIDLHSDEIRLPHRFFYVYIVMFVIAFGVLWEVFEFGLDILAARTGLTMPLAQHGLDDTVKDFMYNTAGAVVVAAWGQAHLSGVAEQLRKHWTGLSK